ncbi:MAG: glycoside hydrolase [Chloroflexi bacterium]|nr:MAG: glycoside hydrolase [Chloroflexota bacterium]
MPTPRRLEMEGGQYSMAGGRLILLDTKNPQALLFSMARRFQRALLARCGLQWEIVGSPAVPASLTGLAVHVHPEFDIPDQGYLLVISAQGISLRARELAGAFYGVCTLIQIVDRCGFSLPCLRITDSPDFPARGVMLDVSRERVPSMETLYSLVDMLAGWKINQLQLYTEHAFAYRQHPQVWEKVTPITGQEVMELDVFCRERFIELVPNQQSFGHLAPWLNHPDYKHLAEVEDGFQTPWGYRQGSFSLSPIDPGSIEFLRGLYAELLPHFSSRMLNVGCDETWDIGQGRSKEACARTGRGRVHLDFLNQVFQEVRRFGRTPQFWGDILVEHPEVIPELPRDGIVLEWGYEADHPFDEHVSLIEASGIPFYVCPGTSSWCSLAGRTDNALANLRSAAESGVKHGASGYLNTDWGDYGHWQAWPVSYLGMIAGAAYAWSLESNRDLDLAESLSWHAFQDASGATGRAAFDLGNVYRAVGIEPHNSSALFRIMQWPLEQIRAAEGFTLANFEKTLEAIETASEPLSRTRMERPDRELVQDEFELTARLLRHACCRGLLALEDEPQKASGIQRQLAADVPALVAEYRRIWLRRNRTGGLAESSARLEKLYQEYTSNISDKISMQREQGGVDELS